MTTRVNGGFTAIELMMVVSIIATLASMSAPSLLRAVNRGQVNDAANAVVRACQQARGMARRHPIAAEHYGVVLYNGSGSERSWAAVTYDATATAGDVLEIAGKAVLRVELAPGVRFMKGGALLPSGGTGTGWMFDYQTGHCIAAPGTAPIDVLDLGVASGDGRLRRALAVYTVGLVHIEQD
ncbi:MAG: prepilin-type N-terminal cleavage/methylation domain-containing protein [Planctomycetes bacterium]|nr:prepilin-type N-terminal cleavage/methylation domain-containing protein [Planctomycetota bacterium]